MNSICPPPPDSYMYNRSTTAKQIITLQHIFTKFSGRHAQAPLALIYTGKNPIPECKNFQACLRNINFK